MIKSALGIAISFFVFALGAPPAHAQGPAAKASAKKHSATKSVKSQSAVRRKAGSTRRAAKGATVKVSAKKTKAVKATAAVRQAAPQRVSFAPPASAAMAAPSAPAVAPVMTAGDLAGLNATRDPLALHSNAAFVIDQATGQPLFEKNADIALPIASLTKLMTALVVVEARQDMNEVLEVTADDIDRERNSSSRLRVGARMTRADMLHIALMSSENRAASALGRHYPGGLPAFVAAMNAKAKSLGMLHTRYVDSTGLSSQNMASARDLARLAVAAYQHPVIRSYSTDQRYAVATGRSQLHYMNSNRLVMSPNWDIGLQKTGYIVEAGRCLVMQARIDNRPVVMVFLDSKGKDSRLGDAARIRKWLERPGTQAHIQVAAHRQG